MTQYDYLVCYFISSGSSFSFGNVLVTLNGKIDNFSQLILLKNKITQEAGEDAIIVNYMLIEERKQ